MWLLACTGPALETGLDTDFCVTHAWQDLDGDGYGDETQASTSCQVPVGYASVSGDCDDLDASVHPGALEVCDDGLDNDCDGRGCPISGELTTADAVWMAHGYASNHYAGTSVDGDWDVNGDGYADLLIGAPQASDGGTAYVALGPLTGVLDLVDADAKIRAPDDAWGGTSVAFVHDLDGDLLPDVVSGAPYADDGPNSSVGAVVITSSTERNTVATEESHVVIGDATMYLGTRVAAAADRDGDGRGDAWASSAPDQVVLLRGGVNGAYTDLLAAQVRHTGGAYSSTVPVPHEADLDGDGLPELVVGFPRHKELAVFEELAATELSELDADVLLTGPESLGQALASGDHDGDGLDDLVIGAPSSASPGVFVLRGPLTAGDVVDQALGSLVGATAGDELGHSVASLPDIDSDGRAELLVSAPYRDTASTNTGEVFLFYDALDGALELLEADVAVLGSNGDLTGYGLAAAGDVNGEGCSGFVVGIYAWDAETGNNAGAAALFPCSPY